MRNVLLMIATMALLSVGYFYYASATQIEREGTLGGPADLAELAESTGRSNPENVMVLTLEDKSSLEMAPGRETGFTIFDEFTGNPVQKFQWSKWEKVPGTRNDVSVESPKLTLYTQALVVSIESDTGQLAVDEVDRRTFRPKKGWLRGNVRISIGDDPKSNTTQASTALRDITINLEEMYFDLELGQLKAAGKLHIDSPAFSLDGTGLQLVWNAVDRRIDRLEIEEGDQLTISLQSGLLDQMRGNKEDEETDQPAEDLAPKRVMTYAVALLEDVEAESYTGEQLTGKLTAEELHLLFDVASRTDEAFEKQPRAEEESEAQAEAEAEPVAVAEAEPEAPTEAENAEPKPEETLVVRWRGPLKLSPQLTGRRTTLLRRHIEARGELVRITGNGTTVECGGLLYREEERRLWLSPRTGLPVTMRMASGPALDASSIFLDRETGIVKMVGDVRVKGLAPGNSRDRLGIRSNLWAELHLAAGGGGASSGLAEATDLPDMTLEKAVFVGGVRADLEGGRALTAQRLETFFTEVPVPTTQPASQPASQPAMLASSSQPSTQPTSQPTTQPNAELAQQPGSNLQISSAIASGHVRLQDGEQALKGTWMQIAFEAGEDGRTYPSQLEARGEVGLQNPNEDVYARGRKLTANLSRDGRLTDAAIEGDSTHPALALAQTYRITGQRLDVVLDKRMGDQQPFHIRVPGRSELLFVSDRGLQGRQRASRAPVQITCERALEFDSDATRNEIRFLGNVIAREGEQQLEADVLTLFLKDVVEAQAEPEGVARIRGLFNQIYAKATGASDGGGILSTGSGNFRKEPLRLRAQSARLTSEAYSPERQRPVVMQEIAAPELTVEIPQRTVRTIGETVLGMTSLRMPSASNNTANRKAAAGLGLPSAMISGGPSQTALMCTGSMTYVFGEQDGSDDSVLFEGGVFFRHVAGKRIARFAELLPEVANDPTKVAQLKDRNTALTCERLELLLTQAGMGGMPGQGMTLGWLNARGDVRLQDQQGAGIRTVNATQIEFDRNAKTVRVLGDKARNEMARVEYMNRETNRFEQPAVGPAFTIYLESNTVKAENVSGAIQR